MLSRTIIREICVQKLKLNDRFNALTFNFTVDETTVRLCVHVPISRYRVRSHAQSAVIQLLYMFKDMLKDM